MKIPVRGHRLEKIAKKAFENLLDKGYVDAEFVGTKHGLTTIILSYEGEADLEESINARMIKQGLARIDVTPNNPFDEDELFEL